MQHQVTFLSWCPLDLLRPRAIQVGRLGKALAKRGWKVNLVCAELRARVEDDLIDRELETLHRPFFHSVALVPDSEFLANERTEEDDLGKFPLRSKRRLRESWMWRRSPLKEPPNWIEGAVASTARRLRWRWSPLFVSFGQPWSSHLAGLKLKRLYPCTRWIAHFSDPWADNPYLDGAAVMEARTHERSVVMEADAIIFTTQDTADLTMQKYPVCIRRKAQVCPHLSDVGLLDMLNDVPKRNARRLRLLHVGSLYNGKRMSWGLLDALRSLRDENVFKDEIELRLVGDISESVVERVSAYGLEDCISFATPLFYLPSLHEMSGADVLLVMDADLPKSPFLPSKLMDYLIFDKPIVGLTPADSATCRFLKGLGYESAEPNDSESARLLIRKLLLDWRQQRLAPSLAHAVARSEYDLSRGSARFEALFDTLMWSSAK